jgi:hypothetical protein
MKKCRPIDYAKTSRQAEKYMTGAQVETFSAPFLHSVS